MFSGSTATTLRHQVADGNHLIAALEPDDQRALQSALRPVSLERGQVIGARGSGEVYFPRDAVLAYIDDQAEPNVHLGLIGREGMLGWSVAMDSRAEAFCGRAQLLGGTVMVMPAEELRRLMSERPAIRAVILRFVLSFIEQLGQTVASGSRDQAERRLARWLLMLHDRLDGDEIPLTHLEMADTLNVRRATVTDCLHILEGEHVLRCTRGLIAVRDRAALELVAGDSYGVAEASYRRLVGPFGKMVAA